MNSISFTPTIGRWPHRKIATGCLDLTFSTSAASWHTNGDTTTRTSDSPTLLTGLGNDSDLLTATYDLVRSIAKKRLISGNRLFPYRRLAVSQDPRRPGDISEPYPLHTEVEEGDSRTGDVHGVIGHQMSFITRGPQISRPPSPDRHTPVLDNTAMKFLRLAQGEIPLYASRRYSSSFFFRTYSAAL